MGGGRQRDGRMGSKELDMDLDSLVSPGSKRTYGGSVGEELFRDGEDEPTHARKRRSSSYLDASILEKLRKRETGELSSRQFPLVCTKERFSNFRMQKSIDTFDPDTDELEMPFQRTRSKIIELVSTNNLIFALTKTGVCMAYDRDRKARVCFLNTTPDEVIRSLFLNKANDSMITVSVFREDNFSSLRCRSTPLTFIRRKRLDAGALLFVSESLKWPGFVEFDDINSMVLTFSSETKEYKVWDLVDYRHLYTIHNTRIQEIKVSPKIMLLVFARSLGGGYVPVQILDIETGKIIREFKHLLHRHKKVDFIEQFNEMLLVKQERENLQIVDVNTSRVIEIERSQLLSPGAFIFLYDKQLFITFRNRAVSVWNFLGELVSNFEDHELWYSDVHSDGQSNNNNVHVLSQMDIIISFCKNTDCRHNVLDEAHGSINVTSISTGRCIAKLDCGPAFPKHQFALRGVSALFYNEERNEIYTGSRSGMVYIWSNYPEKDESL